MARRRRLGSLLIAALSAVGFIAPMAPPAAAAPIGEISGHVLLGVAPMPGLTVSLQGQNPPFDFHNAMTGLDGEFSVTGLEEGSYSVSVAPPGYPQRSYTTGAMGLMMTPVVISTATPIHAGIDIVYPTGAITGSVEWRGAPLAGANVTTYAGMSFGGSISTVDGEFAVRGIDPTTTQLMVSSTTAGGSAPSQSISLTSASPEINGVHVVIAPGRITGTVLDAVGSPVSMAFVTATTPAGMYLASGSAGPTGQFVLGGLPEGTVRLTAAPTGATATVHPTTYEITAGSPDVSGVAIQLQAPGSITGRVTDANGTGLANVYVVAQSANPGMGVSTDPLGYYTITNLTPGVYTVMAQTMGGAVWHPSAKQQLNAGPVQVTAGQTTTAHIAVPAPASVSGRITRTDGSAVESATVSAIGTNFFTPITTTTDADGEYTLSPLEAGTSYRLRFTGPVGSSLREEFYENADAATATPIVLGGGEARVGVDAMLATSASVSGSVTDTAGQPVDANVTLYPPGQPVTASASSTTGGAFNIADVIAGTYVLYVAPHGADFGPSIHAPEYYGGGYTEATATTITVVEGQPISGLDVVVDIGGTISGTVTAASSGAPAPHSTMSINPQGVPDPFGWPWSPGSDDNGEYTIIGVPPIPVVVGAAPELQSGLLTEFHPAGFTNAAATPMTVGLGSSLTGVDFALDRGIYASTTMRNAAGPVPSATAGFGVGPVTCVSPGVFVGVSGCDTTESIGSSPAVDGTSWTVGPLAPGVTYNIRAANVFAGQLGDVVTVTPSANEMVSCDLRFGGAAGISTCAAAPASPAATVTGRVVGPEGLGLANVGITADITPTRSAPTKVYTDSLGYFEMTNLDPGTYRLRATPPAARTDLIVEWRSTAGTAYRFEEGDAMTVTSGQLVSGANIRLDGGASGTATLSDNGNDVTGTTGRGIALCKSPATYRGSFFSCSDGSSALLGSFGNPNTYTAVPPGTYQVRGADVFAGRLGHPTTITLGSSDSFSCAMTLDATGSSCTVTPAAVDSDGVDESVEDAAPNGGDGNDDGVADNAQSNVTSLADPTVADPAGTGANYVTIAVEQPAGGSLPVVLTDVTLEQAPADDPLPPGVTPQSGLIGFLVQNLDTPIGAGQPTSVTVSVYLPEEADAYFKYDSVTGTWTDATALVDFAPAPIQIGGVDRWLATITLTDGAFGDQDGTVNGTIDDPGVFALAGPSDTTAPQITCPAAPTVVLNATGRTLSALVTDESGGSGVVDSSVTVSLATTELGNRFVEVTAADLAGNSTTVACPYVVGVRFVGFSAPVSSREVNEIESGEVVPLKWRTVDASGHPVSSSAGFVELRIGTSSCRREATVTWLDEVPTTVGGLKYLGNGNWQIKWRAPSRWRSGCRVVQVVLAGGNGPMAVFEKD